jgi:hypothetical protein
MANGTEGFTPQELEEFEQLKLALQKKCDEAASKGLSDPGKKDTSPFFASMEFLTQAPNKYLVPLNLYILEEIRKKKDAPHSGFSR